jgi:hypothetical protein
MPRRHHDLRGGFNAALAREALMDRRRDRPSGLRVDRLGYAIAAPGMLRRETGGAVRLRLRRRRSVKFGTLATAVRRIAVGAVDRLLGLRRDVGGRHGGDPSLVRRDARSGVNAGISTYGNTVLVGIPPPSRPMQRRGGGDGPHHRCTCR